MDSGRAKWLLIAMLSLGQIGRADDIYLRTGAVYHGTIIGETETEVTLKVYFDDMTRNDEEHYTKITVEKSRILRIVKKGSLLKKKEVETFVEPKKPEKKVPSTSKEEPQTIETTAPSPDPATDPKDNDKEPEIDPALKARIISLIKQTESLEDTVRDQAIAKLKAIGKDAGPFLAETLKGSGSRRAQLAMIQIFRETGCKEATKVLIDKMEGTNADRTVMEQSALAIKTITGQTFHFNEKQSLAKRNADRQKVLDWFASVEEKYPDQYLYPRPKKEEEKKP